MLYIIRCNDILSDPRAMKYVKYLKDTKHDFKLIGWDRDNIITDNNNSFFLKNKAGYNVGGIKAVKNRILWMWFVLKTLIKEKPDKPVLHACDLDAAFPSVIYKIFFNKKTIVIFDVFDWFSATLYNQGRIVLNAFAFMEKISVNHSDHIIICEPERVEQIPYKIKKEQLHILPNIPYFSDSSFLVNSNNYKFDNDNIIFGYVGGFSNDRCLIEIINIAEKGQINLLIAGFGNNEIENKLESLNNSPYIKYYKKVEYSHGLNILYNSNIVYAMYDKRNPNHIYAAPNKLYESMFLGKAIFSTKGTIVERKIEHMKIGYTSIESMDDISKTIDLIDQNELHIKGENAKKLWNDKFSHYVNDFFENTYSKIIE